MWRYLAYRANGDGTETFLAGDLPLVDVQITWSLSGVDAIDATVPLEVATLADRSSSRSIFVPWSTVIVAEQDGRVRAACIVTDVDIDDQALKISSDGFTGYLNGLPYVGLSQFVNADPLDIARHIWEHVQGEPDGNLGVRVVCDPPSSPLRLGKLPVEQWPMYDLEKVVPLLPAGASFRVNAVNAKNKTTVLYGTATRTLDTAKAAAGTAYYIRDRKTGVLSELDTWDEGVPAGYDLLGGAVTKAPKVDSEDGEQLEPYKLEWFTDSDLGSRWTDLAAQGQFDYVMDHEWSGDRVTHTLRIGYNGLGTRRADLRFVVGENVTVVPTITLPGQDFFSGVMVLGAGEGRAMVRATWTRDTPRLRRPRVITAPFADSCRDRFWFGRM